MVILKNASSIKKGDRFWEASWKSALPRKFHPIPTHSTQWSKDPHDGYFDRQTAGHKLGFSAKRNGSSSFGVVFELCPGKPAWACQLSPARTLLYRCFTHTHTLAHEDAHTDAPTHAQTHRYPHTQTHRHTPRHRRRDTHTDTPQRHRQRQRDTDTDTHRRTCDCVRTRTRANTQRRTQGETDWQAGRQAQPHRPTVHNYTHTRTRAQASAPAPKRTDSQRQSVPDLQGASTQNASSNTHTHNTHKHEHKRAILCAGKNQRVTEFQPRVFTLNHVTGCHSCNMASLTPGSGMGGGGWQRLYWVAVAGSRLQRVAGQAWPLHQPRAQLRQPWRNLRTVACPHPTAATNTSTSSNSRDNHR